MTYQVSGTIEYVVELEAISPDRAREIISNHLELYIPIEVKDNYSMDIIEEDLEIDEVDET